MMTMKMRGRRVGFFFTLIALSLGLVACGAATDQGEDQTPTEETPAEEVPAEETPAEETPANEGEAEAPAGNVDVAAAESLYQSTCAACHGANLEGGIGPELAQVGTRLDAAAIKDVILNGRGQMPAQSQLSDADAENMAAWLLQQ